MLTFLASPKPFIGNAGKIQRNAILSWKVMHPEAEIIIYGDGEGVAQACHEMGASHVPDIPCSPSGIPTFNGIAEHARVHAKYDIQCYLNCDIIFLSNIFEVVKNVSFDKYLITGQRIDLREGTDVDVEKDRWQDELFAVINTRKVDLHLPTGMDYFIFKRGMWQSLLPLVIGRGGYDDALVLYCFRNKIPFINATLSIIAVHQFHDYGHQKGGRKTVMWGEDARNNIDLHKNYHSRLDTLDAPWLAVDGSVTANSIQRGLLRKIELYVRFQLGLERISLFFRILWRIGVWVGVVKPKLFSLQDIPQLAFEKQQEV